MGRGTSLNGGPMLEIKDNVLKTEKVAWKELEWLQNEKLKDFFVKSKDLLKESLKNNDYIDPLNVWQDETGKIWVLDGCHRQAALKECENEGVLIPELLTANFIKCRDRKHAAKLVLVYAAKYAQITGEGLYEFIETEGLTLDDFKMEIDLPEIDFDDFEKNFFIDGIEEEIDPGPELEFTQELMESHNYLVLYFENEIDWQTAMEKFRIKTVKTQDSTDTYLRKGKGRVLDGADILDRLND
jgi:hypothetical protein